MTPAIDKQPSPVSGLTRRGVSLWMSIAIVLLAIAVAMGPILVSGFSYWDDEDTIALNPELNPPTWANLVERWSRPHLHIYIPLTHTVWHVIALMSPPSDDPMTSNFAAWPFKLTNLVAHAIASVIVLLILRRLTGPRWVAIVGALVFAIHPLQVEAVAWTSGLKDVLCGMLSAACVLVYLGREADAAKPRGRSVAIAILLLILAGLAKPLAMVVPAMLLALDLLVLRRPAAQSIARLVPFVVVSIALAANALLVQPPLAQDTQVSLTLRPLVAVDSIAFYAGKLLVPTNLAYDYGRNAVVAVAAARATPWWFAAKVIVVIAIIALGVLSRRRMPLITLGLLWTAIPLSPVVGLTHFDFAHYSTVADHYVYLPMVGVGLIIATLLGQMRHERMAVVMAGIVLAIWASLTFRQSLTWKTGRSMTLQTLRVNDRSYASWGNLAIDSVRKGRTAEALTFAERAVALRPDDPQSLFVLAHVLHQVGEDTRAIVLLRKAIARSPYSAPFHHRLAALLAKNGEYDEALRELDRTLEINPRYPKAAAERAQLRAFVRAQGATRPTTRP